MFFTTLVSIADLAANLDNPEWIVCDCRHDLADTEAGRRAYAQSHLPGARFVHLDEDLSGPKTGKNGRHPLPDPEVFAHRLGELGIDDGKQVVAYDASGGCYAARLWWMLRWVGHGRAAVLDGGWEAWRRAGQPVTAALPAIQPASFTAHVAAQLAVDAAYLMAHLHQARIRVLDARSTERFRGENETLDPVGGHIPGALNRFYKYNLDADGRFKSAAELREEFSDLLLDAQAPHAVVHQCGSGVTACHNLLAMEIAGLRGSRLYPGSWSEWCADPSRPVAKGGT
ncbi:MAG: sulfurtransferase [Burkholderiales bacterium]